MSDDLKALAAKAAGLPDELASRLHGDTLAELRRDANRLAETIGASAPSPAPAPSGSGSGFDGGQRGLTPRAPYTADEVRELARSRPSEFNRLVDEGLIRGVR